jgi:CCR4-NOT transcription complex subunit 1
VYPSLIKRYPESELGITGILFGCLVQSQLVEKVSLKKALKYVLESLKKEPKSKMHRFSICALNKFKQRLPEWPEYCQLITQTPHFHTFPTELKTVCTGGALPLGGVPIVQTGDAPVSVANARADPTASTAAPLVAAPPGGFGSSNVKVLLAAAEKGGLKEPSSKVQDRIHFVFNNLTENNLDQKARELFEVVTEEDYPWMAQYLVVKRCALEPNFHDLYRKFMDHINLKNFNKAALKETLMNVRILLVRFRHIATRAPLSRVPTCISSQTLCRICSTTGRLRTRRRLQSGRF